MMVTFISQCEKRALARTRKVLDAFAHRIGDHTWQTMITEEGLLTVKKLLRKTATRHTAVSCHWLRSRSRSQLIWIVGSRAKFNLQGAVPVHRSRLKLMHNERENGWQYNEVMVLASAMAGLFHDFGKANQLFQRKLTKKAIKNKKLAEPYRHEWLSLRLFVAFVGAAPDDLSWIHQLLSITEDNRANLIAQQIQTTLFNDEYSNLKGDFCNPFLTLPRFAQLIAWLIISHHRLPLDYKKKSQTKDIQYWLSHNFNCNWNSANAFALTNITAAERQENWSFHQTVPLVSRTWQKKAVELAKRACSCPYLAQQNIDWLNQRFVSHMARLTLMFADQYYSSLPLEKSKKIWRDPMYSALANTDTDRASPNYGDPKQRLDQHSIGVSVNALRFAQNLPALKLTLPALGAHRLLCENTSIPQYRWQNYAFKLAQSVAKASETEGFFGVNMASTGCGKTIANARIMYALADEQQGARFSIALGLRTLTLQTGEAYRQLLQLQKDELAVLIGSQAVHTLYELDQQQKREQQPENTPLFGGSESTEDLLDALVINYEGQIYDGHLKQWLKKQPKLEQLLSAPLLVSTIDHLMPATESERGGKQIAPMLRLLSADLILDEPDDFGIEDSPALCRLVNWAGVLGARVLLSSATLPPALAANLFDAYRAGRTQFNQAQFGGASSARVICAWFDEYQNQLGTDIQNIKDYDKQHQQFIQQRAIKLTTQYPQLRIGKIIPIAPMEQTEINTQQPALAQPPVYFQALATTLYQHLHLLHDAHHTMLANHKKVSVGVIRMANINPMLAVAKQLLSMSPKDGYTLHFCIYHSQFPLALRSEKERSLDVILKRNSGTSLSDYPEIQQALARSDATNHLFIVLGTAVVEVGRDHDYDWAIAEPSSLRALIQLAGRVQRHRQQPVSTPNLLILNQNIRGLRGDKIVYCKPGFETADLPLAEHHLDQLVTPEEIASISALSRIQVPNFSRNFKEFLYAERNKKKQACAVKSFVLQEHRALYLALRPVGQQRAGDTIYRNYKEASLWWDYPCSWSAEFIRQTRFRQSQPQEAFYLRLPTDSNLGWYQRDETSKPYCYTPQNNRFKTVNIQLASGCFWWFEVDIEQLYQHLAAQLQCSVQKASEQFGEIHLNVTNYDDYFHWHPQFGVHQIK